MGQNTHIQWAHHTFNPWIGCAKVSQGCKNCYAETLMDHRYARVQWGERGTRSMTSPATWAEVLRWNKRAALDGVRERVFVASLADVFEDFEGQLLDHKGVPLWWTYGTNKTPGILPTTMASEDRPTSDAMPVTMQIVRRWLFQLIRFCGSLDFLLVTKRPENVRKMWVQNWSCASGDTCSHPDCIAGRNYSNVWLGISTEDQPNLEARVWHALDGKARKLYSKVFLSWEPALAPIFPTRVLDPKQFEEETGEPIVPYDILRGCITGYIDGTNPDTAIDWIIFGGESGPGARDTDMAWAGEVARECEKAGVPFFFKQFGTKLAKALKLKDPKGGDLNEIAGLPGASDFVRQVP
mgnify:CR=1 FL=1